MNPGVSRPDIIRSDTGDVFEIEPWYKGGEGSLIIAEAEAAFYVDQLNFTGGGGTNIKGVPSVGLGLLEHAAPNNWNQVNWKLGNPLIFPPMVARGTVLSIRGQVATIPRGLDLV